MFGLRTAIDNFFLSQLKQQCSQKPLVSAAENRQNFDGNML